MSNQPDVKSEPLDVQATIEALYALLGDDAPPRPDRLANDNPPAELSQEERPHPVRDRILLRHRKERLDFRARIKGPRPIKTIDIELSSIVTANMRNCRETTDEEQFKALLDSMAIDNQINAVSVMEDPQHEGHFILIAGFQRFRAAGELRWKTIRASVFEVKDEFDAFMINFAENLARSTPSTYDQARHCQYLVGRFGISESDLAARMGRSYAHVHNLIKYLSLPASIVDDWKNGHPRLSLSVLQRLASPNTPNPAEIWAKLRARHTKEEQGLPMLSSIEQLAAEQRLDEDDGSDGHISFKRPTKAKMIKLRDVLSRQHMPDTPEKFREMLLDVVDFCRGAKPNIRGVVFAALGRRKKRQPGR